MWNDPRTPAGRKMAFGDRFAAGPGIEKAFPDVRK
jgi:hypothetical protein